MHSHWCGLIYIYPASFFFSLTIPVGPTLFKLFFIIFRLFALFGIFALLLSLVPNVFCVKLAFVWAVGLTLEGKEKSTLGIMDKFTREGDKDSMVYYCWKIQTRSIYLDRRPVRGKTVCEDKTIWHRGG